MLKKVALAFVGLIVAAICAILCLALTKPDEFRVERSAVINAAPEKVFSVLSDFHRSPEWSAFEKLDPNVKRSFSGPESGKGARYSWVGNADAGEGYMEVTDLDPPSKLLLRLHFDKPMEGDSTVAYFLEPQDSATKMTWSMYGPNTFMSKVMQVFMNCDSMMGKFMEQGLANLKAICEK